MIDRAGVEQTALDLVGAAVQRGTPPGASLAIEGAAGIGKTFLLRKIMDWVPASAAQQLLIAAEPGRRHEPYAPLAAAGILPGGPPDAADAAGAAFDRVDELCEAVWSGELAVDVARVALAAMDQRLAGHCCPSCCRTATSAGPPWSRRSAP